MGAKDAMTQFISSNRILPGVKLDLANFDTFPTERKELRRHDLKAIRAS